MFAVFWGSVSPSISATECSRGFEKPLPPD
jgi:hypothetical protein